jgi:hypothetical protein
MVQSLDGRKRIPNRLLPLLARRLIARQWIGQWSRGTSYSVIDTRDQAFAGSHLVYYLLTARYQSSSGMIVRLADIYVQGYSGSRCWLSAQVSQ